jgi:hypothetical protein
LSHFAMSLGSGECFISFWQNLTIAAGVGFFCPA